MKPFVDYLERCRTLSDPTNQCLRCGTAVVSISLQEDDRLRDAIRYSWNASSVAGGPKYASRRNQSSGPRMTYL